MSPFNIAAFGRSAGLSPADMVTIERTAQFFERMRSTTSKDYAARLGIWFATVQYTNLARVAMHPDDPARAAMKDTMLMLLFELGLNREHAITITALMPKPWPDLFEGVPTCGCQDCALERQLRNSNLN